VTEHQAEESEAIPCAVCRRPLREEDPPRVCHACIGKARADLHAIVNAYATLPDIVHHPLGSNAPRPQEGGRASERPMPGGNALVMLAGGGDGRGQLWSEHFGADDMNGDPPSVPYELGRWEDDWRRTRGEPAALTGYYVASAAAYLLQHTPWAARTHPEFDEFVDDLRRLRHTLEHAAGLADTPVRADAPCFDCGGTLERHYRDRHGLDDDWICRGCRRQYTPAAYYLAVRAELETRATRPEEGEAS
jgi:hypothetical protein